MLLHSYSQVNCCFRDRDHGKEKYSIAYLDKSRRDKILLELKENKVYVIQ